MVKTYISESIIDELMLTLINATTYVSMKKNVRNRVRKNSLLPSPSFVHLSSMGHNASITDSTRPPQNVDLRTLRVSIDSGLIAPLFDSLCSRTFEVSVICYGTT